MLIFKVLHILSMFAMVTTEIGSEFLYAFAISRRDVHGLATIHRILEQARLGPISLVALGSGVVFGLLTAATGGFDFSDGWLIAAYLLVALFLATASLYLRGALKVGREAVEADAGQRPAEEVIRTMAGSRALAWFAIDVAIVAAIIADMVLKPF
jgi:uncharacterized membrane protein